jgi:septum formation protein
MTAIVLASGSPRRLEMLSRLGVPVVVRPADIDESVRPGEDPREYVTRLAEEKCAVVAVHHTEQAVIAADTTVDVDGEIFGKPADAHEATQMLRSLSGREHLVHTGVTVRRGDRVATGVATTVVRFVEMSAADVAWYVGTGEPFDKAGAYGIQGAGGVFVESVIGSVSNVAGLPLTLTLELARSLGVELLG